MDTAKAIQLLHRLQDEQFDGVHGDERREALEMAVRALSSQQTDTDSQGLVNDCISRKQAIEAFEPTHYTDWYTPTIIETLETLPSVRPEVLACGSGELVKESDGLVNDLVKDCISRRQAIEVVEEYADRLQMVNWKENPCVPYKVHALNWCINSLRELPSAQPEQHLCRDCKWVKYYGNVDKNGNVESYWHCMNWDGGTDEEGYCHEWESK